MTGTKSAVVIDTNVAVVANGGAEQSRVGVPTYLHS